MTDLVETLTWLVDIPSVTGDEAALRDAVASRLGSLPQQKIADSLVVGVPGDGAVVLAGHLDTVPAQGESRSRVDGERVHGLGATDMKAGLAVMTMCTAVANWYRPGGPATPEQIADRYAILALAMLGARQTD